MSICRLVFVVLLCVYVATIFIAGPVSSNITNGFTSVTSSAAATLLMPFLAIVLTIMSNMAVFFDAKGKVGVFKRFVAAMIDLHICCVFVIVPAVFLTLVIEYCYTGLWQWSFERSFNRYTDWFVTLFVFAGLYCIYLYFHKHVKLSKPTAGQFIMGYRIIENETELQELRYKNYLFMSALAGSLWLFSMFSKPDREGLYWWERNNGYRALPIKSKSDGV